MTAFLALLACGLLVLAVLGIVADVWDPYSERRDARSRNHARRLR